MITCKNEKCLHDYVNKCHRENECCSLEYERQITELEAKVEKLKSCLNCDSKNSCNSWKITETMACCDWKMRGEK